MMQGMKPFVLSFFVIILACGALKFGRFRRYQFSQNSMPTDEARSNNVPKVRIIASVFVIVLDLFNL